MSYRWRVYKKTMILWDKVRKEGNACSPGLNPDPQKWYPVKRSLRIDSTIFVNRSRMFSGEVASLRMVLEWNNRDH